MLVYAGIDEAGYGPMLGPLTVGSVTFVWPDYDPAAGAPAMWSMLNRVVAKSPKDARGRRIVVNDSKKLKLASSSRRHPLTHLERGALAFLHALDAWWPETDIDLYERVSPGLATQVALLPWYAGEPLALPVSVPDADGAEMRITAGALGRALTRAGIQSVEPACLVMTAPQFNEMVGRLHSKAAVNFGLVGRHLARILHEHPDDHSRIIVDHQGSRTRYRRPLQMLFPEAFIEIVAETESISRYVMSEGDRRATITFARQAEAIHFPVALASMLAKYIRELLMIRFNRCFRGHLPDLRPTAGYVQDARRFLADIRPIRSSVGFDVQEMIRCR